MKTFLLLVAMISALAWLMVTKRIAPPSTTISPVSSLLTQPTPTPKLPPLPPEKTLPNEYHIFQTFNNCGPAALSMSLSYYGIEETQQTLGIALRPYQNPAGDNDDKSVTLVELATHAETYNLLAYHRPNGNTELLKRFISQDMPVITRTWLKKDEDIGHYRIVKGYTVSTLIQDDSLQGKNLTYAHDDFLELWEKFNFEYLVLVPREKQSIAEALIGEDVNEKTAWKKAADRAEQQTKTNSMDTTAWFNLSVARYHIGDYEGSIQAFETVETKLPFRTLWYQIEPILAYEKLEDYTRVFTLTDKILGNHNRAFSELYLIRGRIYEKQGNIDAARSEYENAVRYNVNLPEAKEALARVSR